MPNLLKGARLYNVDSMDEIAASNQTLLWANWEYYFLVENGTMTIERLNELYAGTRQVGFLATFRVGGLVTQTEAFKYLIQKSA
jgi:HK97 family phage major capsid protein